MTDRQLRSPNSRSPNPRSPNPRSPNTRDHEAAPLLHNGSNDRGQNPPDPPSPHRSLAGRLTEVVHEPLTGLTKVLLVEVLILLLISSVFIGLFAGAQHKLNLRNEGGGRDGGDQGNGTQTKTETQTVTHTATAPVTFISATTTTAVSTAFSTIFDVTTAIETTTKTATTTAVYTSISTYTTTDHVTHTVVVGPEPTGPPEIPRPGPSKEVCLTKECIILSASILDSLDTSRDPCEDFYDFANGGWIASHPIPGDKGSVSSFSVVAVQNLQAVQGLLESDPGVYDNGWDSQLLGKLRTLYASCMDEAKLDYLGQVPLQQFVNNIRKIYHGKRIDVSAFNPRQGLSNALGYMHSRGVNALFDFFVDGDVGVDPNVMTLWFTQPPLGLPSKEYYKDQGVLSVYQDIIERLLVTLRDDGVMQMTNLPQRERLHVTLHTEQLEDKERVWPPWPWPPWDDGDEDEDSDTRNPPDDPFLRAHELAREVVKFESEIADATLDPDRLEQDPFGTYNPVSINTLKSALPQINFPDYFATFTPRFFPSRVIITYKPYPSSLSRILERTSSDVIEAYLVVRAALEYAPNLGTTTEAWKAVHRLQEVFSGLRPGAVGERSEFCMRNVDAAMGFATGRYFVNATFPSDSEEKATRILSGVAGAFERSLESVEWMDEETALKAREKAEAIRKKVGFSLSPDTRDPRSLVSYYTLVKLHMDTFFENMLSAAASNIYKMWQKLGKPRNLDEWEIMPVTVEAYYNPTGNEILIPAGILQQPFFSLEWPGYLTYGSFGMIAAHELTHGFDSTGRLYNQQGKLEEWWTRQTSDAYQIREDCIAEQFSAYTIEDGRGGVVHVNGNLTSGENIGDAALIQAYRAWKTQYEDSYDAGQEYLLPGLDYTREQLFFISFARTWAMNNRPVDAVQRARTDPHSPNRYRVDGTVTNIPEFAEVFKCSNRAKLNPPPDKRCTFWS